MYYFVAVNEKYLRKQQLRLGLLRAMRILLQCQMFLRQVLTQPALLDTVASHLAATEEPGMHIHVSKSVFVLLKDKTITLTLQRHQKYSAAIIFC